MRGIMSSSLVLLVMFTTLQIVSSRISNTGTDEQAIIESEAAKLEFTLSTEEKVLGVLGEPFNFTIGLEDVVWGQQDQIEVFWEASSKWVEGLEGQVVVFTRGEELNQTVRLQSSLIGIFELKFFTMGTEGQREGVEGGEKVELLVRRVNVDSNLILIGVFTLIVFVAMALMGLDIDVTVILSTLKKPVGPLVGVLCQFLLMPCFSYFLGWALLDTNYERLGFLLLGCSPGGANSNFWTAMFHGDVNLSVTMTFVSSVASFALTTMWVKLLGTPMVGEDINIPYERIAIALVSFTVPLLIGTAFKYKWPKKAFWLKSKLARPFFLVALIVMPVIALYNNVHFFYLVTWRHIVCGASLGLLGYIFGAMAAFLARQERPQIIAISLETAMQNGGIAFVVINLMFPSPISDMGIIPIVSFFFCSTGGPPMFLAFAVYSIVKKAKEMIEFKQVPTKDDKELENGVKDAKIAL